MPWSFRVQVHGKGKGKGEDGHGRGEGEDGGSRRRNPRVALPWSLYSDGARDDQGRAVGFDECAKRLVDWCQKFECDDRGVGLEALEGLSGDVWKAAHDSGAEQI